MNDDQQALMYDQMINWTSRLAREMPVIAAYFTQTAPTTSEKATVLDMACSSGRHSLALAELGYKTVGVDISQPFIDLASRLAQEHPQGKNCSFHALDATSKQMVDTLKGKYFDHAILLGNAVANMGSFAAAQMLMRNIFVLLRPGGSFFVQTVHRPENLWYNPLRRRENTIIQRIMVPIPDQTHNVVLHVNQIVFEPGEIMEIDEEGASSDEIQENHEIPYYLRRSSDNTFFMFTHTEFTKLVESIGYRVEAVYHHYSEDPVREEDGETQTWRLRKPEIELTEQGIELFKGFNREIDAVKASVLQIWQNIMQDEWYHCMRSYRFLHPRIVAHPRYGEVVEMIQAAPEIPVLDIACHMGTDLRQLQLEGATRLVGVDLHQSFIDAGYVVFDDKESSTIEFHVFDLLMDKVMKIGLTGSVDSEFARFGSDFGVIHAGSLLHLLYEDEVETIVERMFSLLIEGGVFFGRTVGSAVPGKHFDGLRYIHSLESLQLLLKKTGFSEVEVVIMPQTGPAGEVSTEKVMQMMFYASK